VVAKKSKCPSCKSKNVRVKGNKRNEAGTIYGKRWICSDCKKTWIVRDEVVKDSVCVVKEKSVNITYKIPKLLLLDIETVPMTVLSWSLFKPMISHTNIVRDWNILSWSAKWIYDSHMMSDVLTPEEAIAGEDKRIMGGLWTLLDEADIIIGHNVDKFDLRRVNARFILNGLIPPSPYKTIDTLRSAQKNFHFSSNRLDYLGMLIRNKGKIHTDFELWKRCMAGEIEALEEMKTYNEEDVRVLEEVYVFLRPFFKLHPNLGLLMEAGKEVCAYCGHDELFECGNYYTTVAEYTALRCAKCGAPSRRRNSNLTLSDRKTLLTTCAK
jgi:hypothetical protein